LNPKQSSRGVAVNILNEILEKDAYANIALRKALPESNLDSRDRAFVTELVNETLRNLLSIDFVINHFSKLPVSEMKPFIRNLLRVSVCQLRHIEKTPESAAVNEAVILAKQNGYSGLSGFVNGVLRTIVRQPSAPPMPSPKSPDYLINRYSYPSWLAKKLIRWLGQENAEDFCKNSHKPPPVTIFTNTHKTTLEALAGRLQEEGAESTVLDESFLVLKNSGDIARLSAFKEGLFFVMDPGAALAVKAMNLKPGQTLIDLCAAPGGKSFAAACTIGNTGNIKAYDVHPHRTALIKESIKRMGLTCITPETKDATIFDPTLEASADVVLLDAPCTGFGTIRKRPEIKYNRKLSDINALAEKQRYMLSVSAKYVKPGGILVYSTCTVAREENIDNIKWFLENNPFSMQPAELPNPESINFVVEENCLQILPGPYNDGFFVAAMIKASH